MTTEEFEGHLMAVLHGPNSGKIAGRIFEVAFADAAVGNALSELLGLATDDTDETVFELALLAHLSDLTPKRGDAMAWSVKRHKALQRVRARLASLVCKHPDAQQLAETFMLDLASATQPVGD